MLVTYVCFPASLLLGQLLNLILCVELLNLVKSVMLLVCRTACHLLCRSFALIERLWRCDWHHLIQHVWGGRERLLGLLLIQEAAYMVSRWLLLDGYIKVPHVFLKNRTIIIRRDFSSKIFFQSIMTLPCLCIRMFSVLVMYFLVGRLLSVCTAAHGLIWRLVRCFAHIVDVFEHKLGLFWHSHCTIVHLLQGRNLICRILQIIILKFVWGEWSTLWQWRIT